LVVEIGIIEICDPLPPPTTTIQATLAYIIDMDFHQVVQTTDIEAINLVVKDDETCHLFLKC
jgi:hypothetical protein